MNRLLLSGWGGAMRKKKANDIRQMHKELNAIFRLPQQSASSNIPVEFHERNSWQQKHVFYTVKGFPRAANP